MTADGGPELVQLLTPEGERVHHPDYDIELSPDQLRGLYRDLVLVRRVDSEATALQRQGELGLWAQCIGQEEPRVRYRACGTAGGFGMSGCLPSATLRRW